MKKLVTILMLFFAFAASRADVYVIEAGKKGFSPAEITVKAGDTIKFIRTAGDHSVKSGGGEWEPFTLNNDKTEYMIVLEKIGVYPFVSSFRSDAGMSGSITVESGKSSAGSNEKALNIYPNPAADVINIEARYPEIDEIAIYNLLGKAVFSISRFDNSRKIDISSIPSGVYYVVVKKGGEIIQTEKLIKR